MGKIALITGITGQDGSYLTEFLLSKGYEVHGILRRSSTFNTGRIEHLYLKDTIKGTIMPSKVRLHYGDLSDAINIMTLVQKIKPTEIYNLAAQSHVKVSFEIPEYTANIDALGILRILEAVKLLEIHNKCKVYQASTSELYGAVLETPQNENTPFNPVSPYAIAKQYAYNLTKIYREAYDIFVVNGILFNHESERRGETFVTKKISSAAARISRKLQNKLYLGNLDAMRDWGYAPDYVESMWLMLQHHTPEDFVIATGKQYSIRDFCYLAFKYVGIEIEWKASGLDEKGYNKQTGECLIEVDPSNFRPLEVQTLLGDSTKAQRLLGWNPSKTSFQDLVEKMVKHSLDTLN